MYRPTLEALSERGRTLLALSNSLTWPEVVDNLFSVKRFQKSLASLKAAVQAPLQVQLLQIRNEFAGLESGAEKQEQKLKEQVLSEYKSSVQRRDAAVLEANEAYAKTDLEAVQKAMLKASEAELNLPTGISLRQQLRIDIADKAQIPITYLKTDDAKIRASKEEIPGVVKRHELVVAVTVDGDDDE